MPFRWFQTILLGWHGDIDTHGTVITALFPLKPLQSHSERFLWTFASQNWWREH